MTNRCIFISIASSLDRTWRYLKTLPSFLTYFTIKLARLVWVSSLDDANFSEIVRSGLSNKVKVWFSRFERARRAKVMKWLKVSASLVLPSKASILISPNCYAKNCFPKDRAQHSSPPSLSPDALKFWSLTNLSIFDICFTAWCNSSSRITICACTGTAISVAAIVLYHSLASEDALHTLIYRFLKSSLMIPRHRFVVCRQLDRSWNWSIWSRDMKCF